MPDSVPQTIVHWLAQQGWQLRRCSRLQGGCVAEVQRLDVITAAGDSKSLVVKSGARTGAAEAAGLQVLARAGGLAVPEVIAMTDESLLMSYLPTVSRCDGFDELLGQGLARQHCCESERFGFDCTTYCGGTAQNNAWQDDGYQFFAEQRLLALGRRCREAGLLTSRDLQQLESLCHRLPDLLPGQAPMLLHGDLWYGNVMTDAAGRPALIDPAVYYGWAEAELAMTLMFGGFSTRVYEAYQAVKPLLPGWQKRADIYNLYHYLNHLLLFGDTYRRDVQRIVQYYAP